MIPYGRQDITEDDIKAVTDVLRSDFLTQGPQVPLFEDSVAAACENEVQVVAVNSATSALHIACMALDVGPGDIVWTSPITFVASANCALYCGADVDFVDIDPDTWNMSVAELEAKLEAAANNGKLPKVVIPVHLCGQSCQMGAIGKLAQKYGFKVIEDASHAVGASYDGQPVGNCAHSDITVFSFHPVKIVTTAEGGAATTRNPELARRMQILRTHGITRDSVLMEGKSDGPWYYQQIDLGYNYRMTELQAALGVSQMTRLTGYIDRRRDIAAQYNEQLSELPVQLPHCEPNALSSWHLYVIRVESSRHRQIFENLREAGIGVNLHYIPVPSQPWYRRLGHDPAQFPNSQAYYSEAISIPLHPGMSENNIASVVSALRSHF